MKKDKREIKENCLKSAENFILKSELYSVWNILQKGTPAFKSIVEIMVEYADLVNTNKDNEKTI